MFKQCEPQSWLSHCFQVGDCISLELLVTVSRDSSARTSRTWVVMENIQDRAVASLYLKGKWGEWSPHFQQKQCSRGARAYESVFSQSTGVIFAPKDITSAHTGPIALTPTFGLRKCFFLDMLSKWLWSLSLFSYNCIWLESGLQQSGLGSCSEGMQVGAHWRDSQ